MKFLELYSNQEEFNTLVWVPLGTNFSQESWYNNPYLTKEKVYFQLKNKYSFRILRYEIPEFNNYFQSYVVKGLESFYLSTQVWLDTTLSTIKDPKLRGSIRESLSNATNDMYQAPSVIDQKAKSLTEEDEVQQRNQNKINSDLNDYAYSIVENTYKLFNEKMNSLWTDFLASFNDLFTSYNIEDCPQPCEDLKVQVTTNTANIETNKGFIDNNILEIENNANNIATNTTNIATNTTNIATNVDSITTNAEDIDVLKQIQQNYKNVDVPQNKYLKIWEGGEFQGDTDLDVILAFDGDPFGASPRAFIRIYKESTNPPVVKIETFNGDYNDFITLNNQFYFSSLISDPSKNVLVAKTVTTTGNNNGWSFINLYSNEPESFPLEVIDGSDLNIQTPITPIFVSKATSFQDITSTYQTRDYSGDLGKRVKITTSLTGAPLVFEFKITNVSGGKINTNFSMRPLTSGAGSVITAQSIFYTNDRQGGTLPDLTRLISITYENQATTPITIATFGDAISSFEIEETS